MYFFRKYQSADQDDLWRFLTAEARSKGVFDDTLAVKDIMDTWTLQTGFPVVTVTRDYEHNKLEFAQERFIFIEPSGSNSTRGNETSVEKPLWWIPITFTTLGESDFNSTKPSIWMRAEEKLTLHDMDIPQHDWVIVNVQQTGRLAMCEDPKDHLIHNLPSRILPRQL